MPRSSSGGSGALAVASSQPVVLAMLCVVPVMMRRSFARVMATYSRRISSESVSVSSCAAIACRAMVGYSTPCSRSVHFGPRPSAGCTSTLVRASDLLNRRAVSHKNTNGNSSPLDLWMLRMRTLRLSLPGTVGSSPSAACRCIQSRKRCSPRAPVRSNCCARSSRSSTLRRRSSPSGIALVSAMTARSSTTCHRNSPSGSSIDSAR